MHVKARTVIWQLMANQTVELRGTVFVCQRWVRCFRSPLIDGLVSTTNGVERQHEHLKYSILSDTSSGTLMTY